jgi:phage replication-related protein YjqB (UPF0714/DUF867 family)
MHTESAPVLEQVWVLGWEQVLARVLVRELEAQGWELAWALVLEQGWEPG